MKLGVMAVCFKDTPFEEALAYLKSQGVQELEIGCGGSPGTDFCDAVKFIENPELITEFCNTIEKYGMPVAALAVHGNPIHPNKEIAELADKEFRAAVLLAEKIGVKTVITFSGCPGDCEESKYPNWSIAAWPTDYQKIREWQWNEKLIPYWKDAGAFAEAHGVRVALEIHPGFCVYNTSTLLRLREAVGPVIGANLDPSHLFWQGIDPVAAIRALKGAIYHFHAKDTKIDKYNTAVNGVIDSAPLSDLGDRPWIFRSVGYGHDASVWKDIFSALQNSGYDGIISIEHEDGLMTQKEGLEKAIKCLKECMIFDKLNDNMFWA